MRRSDPRAAVSVGSSALLALLIAAGSAAPQVDPPAVVINEVHADPAADLAGDANGDGVRDTYQDEFIELVNRGGITADLTGWLLEVGGSDPFVFPEGTRLGPGGYLAVFGGGIPTRLPGQALVSDGRLGAGLPNTAGRILLIDPAGPDTLQDVSYQDWDVDAALVREPEGWGNFVRHDILHGPRFSPAAPSAESGGPFSDRPALYRVRVVNHTSAGYGLAWRTGSAADARLVVSSDGSTIHRVDTTPVGLLHHAARYGLAPSTPTGWQVVSAGTAVPADTLTPLTTGPVVTSVPYTVHGRVADGSAPVSDAHIFLRARREGALSGWLWARTDSVGRWYLNLGNLRDPEGGAWSWGIVDSLEVEADGGPAGVAAVRIEVTGASPQEVVLPSLEVDPPPLFTWAGDAATVTADTAAVLGYALSDEGEAWARVVLEDTTGLRLTVETLPDPLPRTAAGTFTLVTTGLVEGGHWRPVAVVEDGLNPPQEVIAPGWLRVAHPVGRTLVHPAGIRLFTPRLEDPTLITAHDWLARLPGAGELARWDTGIAAWVSAVRTGGEDVAGEDFPLQAGSGYALVSDGSGEITEQGRRRYDPEAFPLGPGLALAGVSDSLRVRSADTLLEEASLLAVSRWDTDAQRWEGRFRLPDGSRLGPDFTVGWGDAVALERSAAGLWQPRPLPLSVPEDGATVPGRRTISSGIHRDSLRSFDGGPLQVLAGPGGAVTLYWRAGETAQVRLERGGVPLWRTAGSTGSGWERTTVTGLPTGEVHVLLEMPGDDGLRRWVRTTMIGLPVPPAWPRWVWGPASAGDGLRLLTDGRECIEAEPTGDERFTADAARLDPGRPWSLFVLDPAGGWRWRDLAVVEAAGVRELIPDGDLLVVSGLEVSAEGPHGVSLRWQVEQADSGLIFQPFFGYASTQGGGGPGSDPRAWVPAGEPVHWRPGELPVHRLLLTLRPGPGGRTVPEGVAVKVTRPDGRTAWLGPAALPVKGPGSEPRLLAPAPNPFNPCTTLRFSVPAGPPQPVRLEVRDTRGRLVRVLLDGERAPGDWAVDWDGRDESGREVASGIYLARLEIGRAQQVRKLVLLR
jgi:hypothetical protein